MSAVVDVGDLFEDELLDLALGHPLVGVGRAGLEQQRVAGAQRLVAQQVGEVDDAFLVGVPDHQRAVAAVEDLLEHDDLAGTLEAARRDDVHRLVEHDLLAAPEFGGLDLGRHRDAQLATGGEDVDRAVVEQFEEHAVTGRRLREAVDLFLQLHHLLAGVAQRVGQALVAVGQRGDAGLRLGEAILEQAQVPGGLGHLRAQQFELLFEAGRATSQIRVGARGPRRRALPLARSGAGVVLLARIVS